MRPARFWPLILAAIAAAGCGGNKEDPVGSTSAPGPTSSSATSGGREKLKIAMIPKSKIAYFNACEKGGQEATAELGDVEFTFDGPTTDSSEEQTRLLNSFAVKRFDVITVACNDQNQIAPAMKRARDDGIHIVTYDSDADAASSGREFFVNQAKVQDIAEALVDEMVAQVGDAADVAIISSTPTAPNQNNWIQRMVAYRSQKYPRLNQVTIEYGGEDLGLSLEKTQGVLRAHPSVKGIWAITSVAFPAAADAVKRAGKAGQVAVVGLSTPKEMAGFVNEGVVKTVLLWNVVDLGYLTVQAARAVAKGELKPGATTFRAGRLGEVKVEGDQIILGKPMKFTRENIGQFDF